MSKKKRNCVGETIAYIMAPGKLGILCYRGTISAKVANELKHANGLCSAGSVMSLPGGVRTIFAAISHPGKRFTLRYPVAKIENPYSFLSQRWNGFTKA